MERSTHTKDTESLPHNTVRQIADNKVSKHQPGENEGKKTKKRMKRKVVRYMNMDRVGDLKLMDYFFWRGTWRKVQWADDADILYHVLEHNISWSEVKPYLVNKIPGVSFLSAKQEHAFVFKKFVQYNGIKHEDFNFPQTFIMPRDYGEYVETHRVRID